MPRKAKQNTTASKRTATKKADAAKEAAATPAKAKKASANKGTSGKTLNPARIKPLPPSQELAAAVGAKSQQPKVVSQGRDYVKSIPRFTAEASIGPMTQAYRVPYGAAIMYGLYPQWSGEDIDNSWEEGLDD